MTDRKKLYWLDAALKLPGDEGSEDTKHNYQLRLIVPQGPEIWDLHETVYFDSDNLCSLFARVLGFLQALGYDQALYVYDDDWHMHFATFYIYSLAKPQVRIVWRNINAHRKELIG